MDTQNKKYWCPTHPEVESDDLNTICTKCGTMRLIPRENIEDNMPEHKGNCASCASGAKCECGNESHKC